MITNPIPAELWMLPDLWTAQTDAPTTRSLEIASRFPQLPQGLLTPITFWSKI